MKRSENNEDSYPSVEELYFMPFFGSHLPILAHPPAQGDV